MQKLLLILTAVCLAQTAIAKQQQQTYDCSERKYCKEMSSCAEAKYHLNQCGEGRLDRDNDGVPCENVCKK